MSRRGDLLVFVAKVIQEQMAEDESRGHTHEGSEQAANLAQMQEGEQKVQNGAPVQASELFPKNNEFNGAPASPELSGQTQLLDVNQQIGTVSSSNRYPNMQLRKDVPIPQKVVSTFNQSTIEPDQMPVGL